MCVLQLRYCNGEKDEDKNGSSVGLRDDKKRKDVYFSKYNGL